MITHFILGALTYVAAVSICYIPAIKSSQCFMPIGLVCGLLANYLWLTIARSTSVNGEVLKLGIYWDAMLTMVYVLVPAIVFGARLSGWQMIGSILIGLGVVATKV
jgi:hypothetical protein